MALVANTAHPPSSTVARLRALSARAFAGVTPAVLLTLLFLCLVDAVTQHGWTPFVAWRDGWFIGWLLGGVGVSLLLNVSIATVVGLPIIATRNLGPKVGWQRIGALAATIAVTASLATLMTDAAMNEMDDEPPPALDGELFIKLWFRYLPPAVLLTIVLELRWREIESIEAMHAAEIDRLALEREMSAARLQVLQAQIEPHFLFNTLANVRRMYQLNVDAGDELLERLMRYFEVALPRMRDDRSLLSSEASLIEAYLEVQRVRMGARLQFRIAIPPALHALEVPSMMLLTLVENAIKHGLNPLPEGGLIEVRAEQLGGNLELRVDDNGRGLHASEGGGTGLANIRARLASMYGDRAELSLVEQQPRGVAATLVLPVEGSTA